MRRPVFIVSRWRWWLYQLRTTTQIDDYFAHATRALSVYVRLMRLDRPIGIWLLLWPTLWAIWLASNGKPDEHIFIVFSLGVLLTRSAGCVINDYADRRIDSHVRRTRDRPLARGEIDPQEALVLFAGLTLITFGLVLTLSRAVLLMSLIGAGLMISYPFMKRFFPIPQFYLGAAFSWSIPMAYTALQYNTPKVSWLLFLAAVIWVTAYDTMYAMVDREDDLQLGIKSSALLFGDADRAVIAALQAMTLGALWLVGQDLQLGGWYYSGLGAALLLALYQQYLLHDRQPEHCFHAFLNNNYFGMVIFIGIACDYFFR